MDNAAKATAMLQKSARRQHRMLPPIGEDGTLSRRSNATRHISSVQRCTSVRSISSHGAESHKCVPSGLQEAHVKSVRRYAALLSTGHGQQAGKVFHPHPGTSVV